MLDQSRNKIEQHEKKPPKKLDTIGIPGKCKIE